MVDVLRFLTTLIFLIWFNMPLTNLQFNSFQTTHFDVPTFGSDFPSKEELDDLFKPLDDLYLKVTKDTTEMEAEVSRLRNKMSQTNLSVEKRKVKVSKDLIKRLEALERSHGIKVDKKETPSVTQERSSKCKAASGYTWMETGGFCIQLINQSKNWQDAKDHCSQEKSNLLKLDSFAKIHGIRSIISADKATEYYIGANNLDQTGFVWEDGTDLDPGINMWSFNQPSYYVQGGQLRQDCVAILYSDLLKLHYWDDVICSGPKYFICELI